MNELVATDFLLPLIAARHAKVAFTTVRLTALAQLTSVFGA